VDYITIGVSAVAISNVTVASAQPSGTVSNGEPAAADDDKKSYWEEFILLEGKRDSMCFDSVLCLPLEDSGDDARPYDN
jgi:hypothetical protein